MKNVTSKALRELQSLPYREKIGFEFKRVSWFTDDFKRSANNAYGQALIYIERCTAEYEGKPVEQLIRKLRAACRNKYKHRSFKKAIEEYIKERLIDIYVEESWYYKPYKNVNNIVTKNPKVPRTYKHRLNCLKLNDEYRKVPGMILIRYQGLWYEVTAQEVLNDTFQIYDKYRINDQAYTKHILPEHKFHMLYPVKLTKHQLETYELEEQLSWSK